MHFGIETLNHQQEFDMKTSNGQPNTTTAGVGHLARAATGSLVLAAMVGLSGDGKASTFDVGGATLIGTSTLTSGVGGAMLPNTGAYWAAKGSWDNDGRNHTSSLTTPTLTVQNAGTVTLKFKHLYKFEDVQYDGGAIFISVNGGAATYLPGTAFTANGYTGDTSASGIFGNVNVFSNGAGTELESTAILGNSFSAGDKITVTFAGGWDGFWTGSMGGTEWEIHSVQVTDSAANLLNISDLQTGASGFSVASDPVTIQGPWSYAGTETCQFELDATTPAPTPNADQFDTSPAGSVINLNNARLKVVVLSGTLAVGQTFSLFDLSGGSTLEGAYSSLELPPATWDVSGLDPGGNGQIKVIQGATWVPTAGATYDWNDNGNWTGNYPNGTGYVADLHIDLAGDQTVNLNTTITAGTIKLGDSATEYKSMTIAGNGGSLVMDVAIGSALIKRIGGNDVKDTISADIALDDNLIVSDANGSYGKHLNLSGAISGSGKSVTINGIGCVYLSGTNTFTGGLILDGSGAFVGTSSYFIKPSAMGDNTVTINGGNVTFGYYDVDGNWQGQAPTNNNAIVINNDVMSHYGLQTGTGAITIARAGIKVGGGATLGGVVSGPGGLNALDIVFNVPNGMGGAAEFQAPIAMRDNQTVTVDGGQDLGWANFSMWSELKLSGIISDGGNAYGLNIASNTHAAKVLLTAANTFSGDLTVEPSGVATQFVGVGVGNNLALQNSAVVLDHEKLGYFAGGVTTPTLGGLKGSTNMAAAFADAAYSWVTGNYGSVTALTLNVGTGRTCSYSGAIANGAAGMALNKTGDGTQELSGDSTYSGTTTISAGVLRVSNTTGSGTGTGPVVVSSGGTLAGTGTVGGAVTVDGGTIQPTATGTPGTLTLSSATSPVFNASSKLKIRVPTSSTADQVALSDAAAVFACDNVDLTIDATGLSGDAVGLTIVSTAMGDGGVSGVFHSITVIGGHTPSVHYNSSLGTITLDLAAPGYASWASGFSSPPLSDTNANADPDGDGLDNGVEYVLGTDPRYANSGGPSATRDGSNLKFTFTRKDSSETADVSLRVVVSTDLIDWSTLPGYDVGDVSALPEVEVIENGAADDVITVTIPMGSATEKFARLQVTVGL